jgi:hypothetical protein
MKRILIVVLVLTAATASVQALDWTSYPDAIEGGLVQINAGVGIGAPIYGGANLVIPPLVASADFNLPIGGLPFTLGAFFGFTTSKWEQSVAGYGYKVETTGLGFGARFGYHPDFGIKNLDTYANVELGWFAVTAKASSTGGAASASYSTPALGGFLYGANIGARYFFIKNVGVFAELGYSALTFAKAGIALQF